MCKPLSGELLYRLYAHLKQFHYNRLVTHFVLFPRQRRGRWVRQVVIVLFLEFWSFLYLKRSIKSKICYIQVFTFIKCLFSYLSIYGQMFHTIFENLILREFNILKTFAHIEFTYIKFPTSCISIPANKSTNIKLWNEPRREKTCLCHMRTTKAQISLHIHAVWSALLLFAA